MSNVWTSLITFFKRKQLAELEGRRVRDRGVGGKPSWPGEARDLGS